MSSRRTARDPVISSTPEIALYSARSAGLSGCAREFGFGAIARGLSVVMSAMRNKEAAVDLGGNRITKYLVRK
jgi:hypothetical protein